MIIKARRGSANLGLAASILLAMSAAGAAVAEEAAQAADPARALESFNEETFLDAAYNNCATVENRSAQSCTCERKLIGDRIGHDDKQMAYLYWTDKPSFKVAYEAKLKADPEFQRAFSERFSNLQALIIAACGA